MNKSPEPDRKFLTQYQFTDLDKESDFFNVQMSENLREFGFDGDYHPIEMKNLTKLGKAAYDQALNQLKNWLFLDPYKLRRFIQFSCPWSNLDQNYVEQKTETLIERIYSNTEQLRPLAQIMIRLSEHSRNRFQAIQKINLDNKNWYATNYGPSDQDQSWNLGQPVLNAMIQNAQSMMNSIGCGDLPIWIYVAENIASIMKILALFAIQQERAERTLKTMTAIRKSIALTQTMIQNDLKKKTKAPASVSSLDETKSPSSSPKHGDDTSRIYPINSEHNKNIINNLDKSKLNNIFIYNMESGKQQQRPELKPDNYLDNFATLCKSSGLQQNLTQPLFRLLRECYTNPLVYLGPPKNLPSDFLALSQPLTVSKESWKARRLHSLDQLTCARCGMKGHKPANCTEVIRCTKCGKTGHATKGCRISSSNSNSMDEDDKISSSKSKSKKKAHSQKDPKKDPKKNKKAKKP